MKKNVADPKMRREKLASIGKIVVAVLLVLLIVPTMGMMWIKDSRHSPAYCAGCHQDPYYTSWTGGSSAYSLAHQHAELGMSCQTCHDRTLSRSLEETANYLTGNYYYPFQEQKLPIKTCLTCHESYEKVSSLTNTKITGEKRNPHAGHWGELECGECHNMHRDSVDYCAQCHEPIDAPGWKK
jgi:hypothetical protein